MSSALATSSSRRSRGNSSSGGTCRLRTISSRQSSRSCRSIHVHPDHPLDIVVDRLSQSEGVLPVVSRTDAHRVEGIVTPDSILLARDRQRGLGDRVRD